MENMKGNNTLATGGLAGLCYIWRHKGKRIIFNLFFFSSSRGFFGEFQKAKPRGIKPYSQAGFVGVENLGGGHRHESLHTGGFAGLV